MFVFQWNALRVGDRIIVHDDLDAALTLHEGTVHQVDTRPHLENDVGIRLDGPDSEVLRPRRHAVHLLPDDRRFSCWRCDTIATPTADGTRDRAAA